jgi:hypothetical protein
VCSRTHDADEFLKSQPLLTYFDRLLIPALRFAQQDLARGALDVLRQQVIRDAVADVLANISDVEDTDQREGGTKATCAIVARGPLDQAAALVFAQIATDAGYSARILGRSEVLQLRPGVHPYDVFCLSLLQPAPLNSLRHVVRHLRRRFPAAAIFVGAWAGRMPASNPEDTLIRTSEIVSNFEEALAKLRQVQRVARTQETRVESHKL